MLSDLTRVIPLSAVHELRRDFAERIAEAKPLSGNGQDWGSLWDLLPETYLDPLWSSNFCSRGRNLVSKLRSLAPEASGVLLVARSALAEVAREVTSEDSFGRNLSRLLAGEALLAFDHLVLGFDDRLRPYLGLLGDTSSFLPLLDRLHRLADQTVPVLLTGETGTGKEIAARALHRLGRRYSRPWLALNCAELPESILESELFGYMRGSFTGAAADRPGLFEAAEDGTVFLDEIGELRLGAQAKLLRVLEEHRVRRLGNARARPLFCRIVAATNRDLPREIERGRFRSDLYYRLRGVEISLAPLRDRPKDILPLAEGFVARAALRFRRRVIGLSEEAKLALLSHRWPGNVRELRQAVEAGVLAAETGWIRFQDLSVVPQGAPPVETPLLTVRAAERAHILRALTSTAGNRIAAARLLGLTRQSLQRRMIRHGISLPAGNGRSRPKAAAETELPPSAVDQRPKEIR